MNIITHLLENMKWFKNIHGNILFIVMAALYFTTRKPNGDWIQETADVVIIIALVLIIINRVLERFKK